MLRTMERNGGKKRRLSMGVDCNSLSANRPRIETTWDGML